MGLGVLRVWELEDTSENVAPVMCSFIITSLGYQSGFEAPDLIPKPRQASLQIVPISPSVPQLQLFSNNTLCSGFIPHDLRIKACLESFLFCACSSNPRRRCRSDCQMLCRSMRLWRPCLVLDPCQVSTYLLQGTQWKRSISSPSKLALG